MDPPLGVHDRAVLRARTHRARTDGVRKRPHRCAHTLGQFAHAELHPCHVQRAAVPLGQPLDIGGVAQARQLDSRRIGGVG